MGWANVSFLTFTLLFNYRFSSSLRTIVAVTFVLLEDYAIFSPCFLQLTFIAFNLRENLKFLLPFPLIETSPN